MTRRALTTEELQLWRIPLEGPPAEVERRLALLSTDENS